MTISVNQQVDFLWKKLGFGLTKTSVPSMKDATNESIISDPFLPGDKIWTESDLIPTILPVTSIGIVEVYAGGGAGNGSAACVMDITAQHNRTWLTNLTDWVPISYGSTYQVKVFLAPTASIDPRGDGIQLYAAGTNNNDEWFFDYNSGVLHFIGDNLPAVDFTNNTIFIYGGRYRGVKGLGNLNAGTFGDITISGNTISSSVTTITFNASGGAYFGGAVLHEIGYPMSSTDAASVQYVTDSISALHPNAIWQGNSIVEVVDDDILGGVLSITIDGNVISTFNSTTANIANLSITGSSVSSINDFVITPAAGKIVKANTNTALQVPVGLTSERPLAPESGYVRFNTSAGVLECFNGTEWVTTQAVIENQVIVGNGITATYSLVKASPATNLIVATNGVIQLPNIAYTVVGDMITFAETPLSTDIIEVRFISQSVSPIANISNAQIVDGLLVVVSTTPTVVDTFAFGVYRSAKYLMSMTFSDGNSQMADVMVTHNGFLGAAVTIDSQLIATMTPVTGGSPTIITFNTYAWASMCVLTATSSTPNTTIKLHKTYFAM